MDTSNESKSIIIVSGLPRSGTSMVMRMLEAGGIRVVVDGLRAPDEDNPKGYYELEAVKKVKENPLWLKEVRGMAVKVISMLLFDLPKEEDYQIVFLDRYMPEILASQRQMLIRRGRGGDAVDDQRMGVLFRKHLAEVKAWIGVQPNIRVLYLDYNETIQDPMKSAQRVDHFLERSLDVDSMAGVVEGSLYRQRERHLYR